MQEMKKEMATWLKFNGKTNVLYFNEHKTSSVVIWLRQSQKNLDFFHANLFKGCTDKDVLPKYQNIKLYKKKVKSFF